VACKKGETYEYNLLGKILVGKIRTFLKLSVCWTLTSAEELYITEEITFNLWCMLITEESGLV
jgi:hypothetical protein